MKLSVECASANNIYRKNHRLFDNHKILKIFFIAVFLFFLFFFTFNVYARSAQVRIILNIPFQMSVIADTEAKVADAKMLTSSAKNSSHTMNFCVYASKSGGAFSLAVSGANETGALQLEGENIANIPYQVQWVTKGKAVPLESIHSVISPSKSTFVRSNVANNCNSSDYINVEFSKGGLKSLSQQTYHGAAVVVVAAE